jgi:hypothetical protein
MLETLLPRSCEMNRHIVETPTTDEDARRAAAMRRVYSYLLELAARKEAADRDADANHETRTEDDNLALEPGNREAI